VGRPFADAREPTPLNLYRVLFLVTLDVIGEVAFGQQLDTLK
jgi:hypothetical protein